MEVEGCQPTASEPSDILATCLVKVRLPSMASTTGSFTEFHIEGEKKIAYCQASQGLEPATALTTIRVPGGESSIMSCEVKNEDKDGYNRTPSESGTIKCITSNHKESEGEATEYQRLSALQSAPKKSAAPRHSVAIPFNLVIPKIPRESSGTQGNHERSPLAQSEDISPIEEDLPDLIVPRSRNKGKERAFEDRSIHGPPPLLAYEKFLKPSANNSENVSISAESLSRELSQGTQTQHTFNAQLSMDNIYLEEFDSTITGQQDPDSPETLAVKRKGSESVGPYKPKHYQPPLYEGNEEDQGECCDEYIQQAGTSKETSTSAQSPTASSSQEPNKKPYGERSAILTQLMLKFNVRDLSRPELEIRRESDDESEKKKDTKKPEGEENNKQTETSVFVCAEQSRQEASEVKFYYPKQKECGLAPSSAPLVPSASNNSIFHETASRLSSCEGVLLRPRKASSVPVPPKQDMRVEESSCLDGDALSSQYIQGIIMGGPSLSPTCQGSYSTHGNPGVAQQRKIPSVHGVVEDAATCISVPDEPRLIHSHLDGVVNRLVSVQDNALNAVLQRLDTLTRDIHLLRADIHAHNTHLQQLTDRVVAIEETRSDQPTLGEVAERRGVNSGEPSERQMTRSIGVQTTTAPPSNTPFPSEPRSGGQAVSVLSRPSPVDTKPHPAPGIAFEGPSPSGSVNTSLRNPSGGQHKTRSQKRNHTRGGGPVRNIGRGGTITQQRVLSPSERAVPPPQPEILANPPQAGQYQHPFGVPQAFNRQLYPGPGRGSSLLPVVASSSAAPTPFPSMSTTPNAGGQHPPRPRDPSTGVMAWGGTWDWYHRAYPGNYGT